MFQMHLSLRFSEAMITIMATGHAEMKAADKCVWHLLLTVTRLTVPILAIHADSTQTTSQICGSID